LKGVKAHIDSMIEPVSTDWETGPATCLGVDVGGTKIAAGRVTFPEGRVESRRTLPTRPDRGAEAVLADVERLVRELGAEVRSLGREIRAVGLGICELVDARGRIVSGQTVDWQGEATAGRLAGLAQRVVIEADVRAAALAEALFGAGRGRSPFLYVSVGTGISSALVVGGRPFRGARGATGTLASGPWPGLGNPAGNGLPISLEQWAAGPALPRRFRDSYGGQAETAQQVIAAAQAGDPGAIEVVRTAGEALGAGIGWLVNVLDPSRVVVGGGLGLAEGLYHEAMVTAVRRQVWWEGHREVPVVRAETGSDAGLIGAAAAAWLPLEGRV
jgi:glucokinase